MAEGLCEVRHLKQDHPGIEKRLIAVAVSKRIKRNFGTRVGNCPPVVCNQSAKVLSAKNFHPSYFAV